MIEIKRPQKMLGPSQVSTVLGYSRFDTPDVLRNKMENGYTREICSKRVSGTRDEPRCRALYTKETGNTVIKCHFVKDETLNKRFGGCGDGLVGENGGLEIKCQYSGNEPNVYFDYKIQAIAYMYLYKRQWWDIMVCSIDNNDSVNVVIERIYWNTYSQVWKEKWYPQIAAFCESIKWAY